jgi:DNA-binding MarR family transcriptional regulator
VDPTRRRITKVAREANKLVVRSMKDEGVGSGEFDLIHLVRKNPGLTQKRIAEELHMDKGSVARRIANLEHKGYLVRKPNPADHRSNLVYATEAAEGLKYSKAHIEAVFYEWVLGGLADEDRAEFARLMDEVYDRARAESLAGFPHVRAQLQAEGDGAAVGRGVASGRAAGRPKAEGKNIGEN